MRRVFPLVLLLLCPIAAFGRVISYAPYSDQLSIRGYHDRTTRHFVLVEARADNVRDEYVAQGKVVLYDSTGAEAPREIYGPDNIRAVALYQPRASDVPVVMVITQTRTIVSRNYGRSWKQIAELDGFTPQTKMDEDRGGPWTQGIAVPVRIGSGGYPFVVAFREGVYAISSTRAPRLLLAGPTSSHTLVGQNRQGTEFLLHTQRATLIVTNLEGRWRHVTGPTPDEWTGGWIAPDGSVYTIDRAVHRYANGRHEIASGDYETSFAVPTHDFSGAWIIAHLSDVTTTLARYTPASGRQVMWEDEDAPEVEALHTGASANTLLIQVHRERAKQELPFLDPALAIWHVGEPAPAEYDELFLNEGPTKGFVHLDVDKAASGEPFVFDSSFIRPKPPDIVVSPPVSGGSDVIQEWGVVRASLEQRLVLQGITNDGERTTDLVIFNPLDEQQRVAMELAGQTSTITLDPNEIRVIPLTGEGTLSLLPEVGINALAHVHGPNGGHVVQAVDAMNSASPRFPVTFSGAGQNAQLLTTDTSGHGVDAEVSEGMIVKPRRGSFIAGALVTDAATRDTLYFTPDLPASSIRTIPLINEQTQLHLLNYSPSPRSIVLEAKPYDTTQWPRTQTHRLEAWESRVIVNPLKTLFNFAGGPARLRYWSPGAQGDATGVRVTSRIVKTAANGGAYGTAVPPLNSFQTVTGGESLEILGLRAGYRVTLGLVELSPNPRNFQARVRVSIVDERGNTLDTFEQSIAPAGGVVIDDLFQSRNLPQPAAARLVLQTLDDWSLTGAYALLTDPSTGDPTYLGAQLGATPK